MQGAVVVSGGGLRAGCLVQDEQEDLVECVVAVVAVVALSVSEEGQGEGDGEVVLLMEDQEVWRSCCSGSLLLLLFRWSRRQLSSGMTLLRGLLLLLLRFAVRLLRISSSRNARRWCWC